MTFEEDFHKEVKDMPETKTKRPGFEFPAKEFHKNCLDKAKVKEVIDKYIPALPENKNHPSFDKYNAIKDIVLTIKKELGLDDTFFGMEIKTNSSLKDNQFILQTQTQQLIAEIAKNKEVFIIEELKPHFEVVGNKFVAKEYIKVRLAEIEDYKQKVLDIAKKWKSGLEYIGLDLKKELGLE